MRTEIDILGELDVPKDALYGIHSLRARKNFPSESLFHVEWYETLATVKLACYQSVIAYRKAAGESFPEAELPDSLPSDAVLDAMCQVAGEASRGAFFPDFIVPAVQGGAGTSINMNVNEIIANAANIRLGGKPGDHHLVDPFMHANVFQSTNDVVPTALKVSAMLLFRGLEGSINRLRSSVERIEGDNRSHLRMAYTEMQRAVPSSYGMLFSAYNEALSRDWWRVSRCQERLKLVNLGGGAAGTGIAVPRFFIMDVVSRLQQLTLLPLARSENLADATQNLDSLVEVHAILKALAVNLEKMSADLRLLASGLAGQPEVVLPAVQAGSSIMPGKVNPVIPEYVISVAHKVYSNDLLIGGLCGQGSLDLNPYLPVIGHALLESIKLLKGACDTLAGQLFHAIKVNEGTAYQNLLYSPTLSTALIPLVGYREAGRIARLMQEKGVGILEANRELKLVDPDKMKEVLLPENLLKLGYSLKDMH